MLERIPTCSLPLLRKHKEKWRVGLISVSLLILFGCSENPYRNRFNNSRSIREFVAAGGDPDTAFFFENNPKNLYRFLHVAVEKNDLELAKFLIQAGANPNCINYAGETPLMRTFTQPHDSSELKSRSEMIQLLAPVTDLEIRDMYGRTLVDAVREIWGEEWLQFLSSAASEAQKPQTD